MKDDGTPPDGNADGGSNARSRCAVDIPTARRPSLKRTADDVDATAAADPISSTHAALADELQRSGLAIFRPLATHGYFAWDPTGDGTPSSTDPASERDVLRHADPDGRPDQILSLERIRDKLPVALLREEQFDRNATAASLDDKTPISEIGVAALAIAARRGVDLPTGVEFSFGGSTLHFLATKGEGSQGAYVACRVPGTHCIFVSNQTRRPKEPPTNVGFQFERLVTGGDMADASSVRSVEHLHTMKVGDKTVLFRAEVDAVDGNGAPVEVKVSPATWNTSVLFQMISNGSLTLCKGTRTEARAPIRRRGYALGGRNASTQKVLTSVEFLRLSEVAALAFEYADVRALEAHIVHAMRDMQAQLVDDGAYRLEFADDGALRLERADDEARPFPRREVVERLIG